MDMESRISWKKIRKESNDRCIHKDACDKILSGIHSDFLHVISKENRISGIGLRSYQPVYDITCPTSPYPINTFKSCTNSDVDLQITRTGFLIGST
ncbi:hypothetical protein AVEN_43350-1 [Araneus ventricosus]|uniref:Uncharacterized protein n=1 Tax=Araneus ventricosus TaxID=182803 RepID=A0A4Y2FG63_ARAVE|nr:hypothetical protein AVEN_43350-1 [Araneus ventricosus]